MKKGLYFNNCMSEGHDWNNITIHRRSLRFGRTKNIKHRDKYLEWGLWFDYPMCCIDLFRKQCGHYYSPVRSKIQERAMYHQQRRKTFIYVNCHNCSQNYINKIRKHEMVLRK